MPQSGALLRYLADLCDAVLHRDAIAVRGLLDRPFGSHLPRVVREEALAQTRLPRESLRAPIHLLEFSHRMTQFVGLHGSATAQQLELELPTDASRTAARARMRGKRQAASRLRSADGES